LLRLRNQSVNQLCSTSAYIYKHGLHKFKQREYGFECDHIRGSIEIPDRLVLKEKFHKIKKEGVQQAGVLTDFDQTLTRAQLPDGKTADSVFKTIIRYERTP